MFTGKPMITSPSGQVSDDFEIMEGDSERFECNIDYEKELTSAYKWLKDDKQINSEDYLVCTSCSYLKCN